MTWLIDFFKTLGETIVAIIEFVVDFFTGLVNFLASLPSFIRILNGVIGHMPTFLTFFLTISITVSVIFIILGRDGTA